MNSLCCFFVILLHVLHYVFSSWHDTILLSLFCFPLLFFSLSVFTLSLLWYLWSFIWGRHVLNVFLCCHSAGKSFVAEILMLRRVIITGKMALLVLPYVSICAEKVLFSSPLNLEITFMAVVLWVLFEAFSFKIFQNFEFSCFVFSFGFM